MGHVPLAEELDLAEGDVEALLLCLRDVLALVDGEVRVVDEAVVKIVHVLLFLSMKMSR